MQVHEARRDDKSASVEDLFAVRRAAFAGRAHDASRVQDEVQHGINVGGRINYPPADDAQARHSAPPAWSPPNRRYSSAMRTATPFVTCSSITDCAEYATSGSISTPSF